MKIALIGYGKEARSAHAYFSAQYANAEYVIYDVSPHEPHDIPAGASYIQDLGGELRIDADIIVRTPSVAPRRIKTQGQVTTVTQEFFDNCQAPIIGVTGTKGKGTTSSLIAQILQKAGIRTWLVGNIGQAALDVLGEVNAEVVRGRKAVVVYELSSFQLWDLKKSPHVAVLLMLEPEHLDVHDDFADYIAAKTNIIAHQAENDVTVYYADNAQTVQIAAQSQAKKFAYRVEAGEYITARGQRVIKKDAINLVGTHNYENVAAAATAAMEYVDDVSLIAGAIGEFTGLPHRLEVVPSRNVTLRFINDSYASAPPATVAAMKAFHEPEIIIIGGKDRGLSFQSLANELKELSNLKCAILIGETRHKLAAACEAAGVTRYRIHDSQSLDAIVHDAVSLATDGDVIILSPGCASFDMFKDFTDRGEQFKKIVEAL